jgi:hypothetical protein
MATCVPTAHQPQANVRVMVADVDASWQRALGIGAAALATIGDRQYRVRDSTMLDPDGCGIGFGSLLHARNPHAD